MSDVYRVSHLLVDLGWVDFVLDVPAMLPILPNSDMPKQNLADRGKYPKPKSTPPNPGPSSDGSPCIIILQYMYFTYFSKTLMR